jgi:hypothetical protein
MDRQHAFIRRIWIWALLDFILCLLTYPDFSISLIDHGQGNRIVIVPLDCNLQDSIDAHHSLLTKDLILCTNFFSRFKISTNCTESPSMSITQERKTR